MDLGHGVDNNMHGLLTGGQQQKFKDLFLLFFHWKGGYTERRDREEDPMPIRSQETLPGPKALGCPQLLSQATGRELDGKQVCQD